MKFTIPMTATCLRRSVWGFYSERLRGKCLGNEPFVQKGVEVGDEEERRGVFLDFIQI